MQIFWEILSLKECSNLGYNVGANVNVEKTYFGNKSLLDKVSQHLQYTLDDFSPFKLFSIISVCFITIQLWSSVHQS